MKRDDIIGVGTIYLLYEENNATVRKVLFSLRTNDENIEILPGQFLDVYLGRDRRNHRQWAKACLYPHNDCYALCMSRYSTGYDGAFFALASGACVRLYNCYHEGVREEFSAQQKRNKGIPRAAFLAHERARVLRALCLQIAFTVASFLYEKENDESALSATLEHFDALLIEQGIIEDMHDKTEQALFDDPVIVAETIASQWKWMVGAHTIVSEKQATRVIEEFSEGTEEIDGQSIHILSGKDLHPRVRDFALLRSFVALTYRLFDAEEHWYKRKEKE